jgi:hypothetical protein
VPNQGYIKLYRSLLDNPIIKKPDYLCIWNCLLLQANHKETSFIFNNIKQLLEPGQLITGRKVLSDKTGIAESQVYKILNYLEKEQQIRLQKNNKFTLITILNWEKYQGNGTTEIDETEQPSNNQVTTKEQPSNTYKNVKNVNNDKNKDLYGEFVKLTKEQYQKLIEQFGENGAKEKIENLNIGIGSKGYKYTSHYHTILSWDRLEKKRKQNIMQPSLTGIKKLERL